MTSENTALDRGRLPAHASRILDAVEAEEDRLLSWGCTQGAFSSTELLELAERNLGDTGAAPCTASEAVQELLDRGWLFEVPGGAGYRSRMAEAVRLFASLRQWFAGGNDGAWRSAAPLVADFRLARSRRLFPRRDVPADALVASLTTERLLSQRGQKVTKAVLSSDGSTPRSLAAFQVRATERILRAVAQKSGGGTMVCAGTGSGKSLAFYLPAIVAIAERVQDQSWWTKCLALYPRTELLKDQLREAVASADRVTSTLSRPISIGALYQDVPRDESQVAEKWPRVPNSAFGPGHECPFLRCPTCGGAMVWLDADRSAHREGLACAKRGCGKRVSGDALRLTRKCMLAHPPDILFTSSEMLNQRLAAADFRRLWGIGVGTEKRPLLMLLDEVHTYEGSQGAHIAFLVRRWIAETRSRPHVVGLSATLEDAQRFFADLTGIPASAVQEVAPHPEELDSNGFEYQLALRADPTSGTSLLSTSIQALMLTRRILGATCGDPTSGSRVFAFTDNLDVVNRLFHNLRDAEGRQKTSGAVATNKVPLASLRNSLGPQAQDRFPAGQSWNLVEQLGHRLSSDGRLDIQRTSSQDPGVAARADIVVATSSLEVGFDDPEVGAVVQHKAPRSAAGFLQRKGRAGRQLGMRPWTIVTLSDFGRDRSTYQQAEQLFSPTLSPKYLPLRNRVVARMQATYSLLEWLSHSVVPESGWFNPWQALAGPSDNAETRKLQISAAKELRRILESDQVRRSYLNHVQRALGVSEEEAEALLWQGPRSVLLEAVPTLLRQLETNFRSVTSQTEPCADFGPPLIDFLQRTLFGELLVPEIEILGAGGTGRDSPTMLVAQAIREFTPGRVSRRYGLGGYESHWVPVPQAAVAPIESIAPRREYLGTFRVRTLEGHSDYALFRPYTLQVVPPPADIQPTSNATSKWFSVGSRSGTGHMLHLPSARRHPQLVSELRVHSHRLGCPITVRRMAVGAEGTVLRRGGKSPWQSSYDAEVSGTRIPAAIGFTGSFDALEVRFQYPPLVERASQLPELLRALRPARLRHLLRSNSTLDPLLNVFQRDMLAEAFMAAVALEVCGRDSKTDEAVTNVLGDLGPQLLRVLSPLGAWGGDDDLDDDDDGPPTAGRGPHLPKRTAELVASLGDPVVRSAMAAASLALTEPPTEGWEPWLQERYRATLCSAFLEAVSEACPEIATDALSTDVDLQFAEDEVGSPAAKVWLVETSIGGSGAIDAFARTYVQDPGRFFRFLDMELEPTGLEPTYCALDRLALAAPEAPELVSAFQAVRAASDHRSALAAQAKLRASLASIGLVPESSLLVATNARILRPGSSTRSDELLRRLLLRANACVERLGFDLDSRTVALLFSNDDGVEQALDLAAFAADAAWRAAILRDWLWPRGGELRRESLRLQNQFLKPAECDRLLLKVTPSTGMQSVLYAAGDSWRVELCALLAANGAAELLFEPAHQKALSTVILELAVHPIETEGLRLFSRLASVRRDDSNLVATFETPEALQ